MVLIQLVDLYSLVVLGAVVVSWIQLPSTHPVVGFLSMLTEPLLAPIRRVLPDMGGFDFSPVVLFFGLRMVRGIVLSVALGS